MRTRDVIVMTMVLTCLMVSLTIAYLEHVWTSGSTSTSNTSTSTSTSDSTLSTDASVVTTTLVTSDTSNAWAVSNLSVSTALVNPLLLDHAELVSNGGSLFYSSLPTS